MILIEISGTQLPFLENQITEIMLKENSAATSKGCLLKAIMPRFYHIAIHLKHRLVITFQNTML